MLNKFQQFYLDHIDPDGIQPLQAVRTVAAAVLAMLLYHSLSWPQAFWILFSTILILQTYNAATPKQKWIFLLGTGLITTGVTFAASLLGQNIIVLAIFLTFTTFMAVYLNIISPEIGNAAFFVNLFGLYAGAVSLHLPETLERTASVFFGFLIAIVVCACLWPERLSATIRFIISQNLSRLSEFNRTLFEREQSPKAIRVRRNRLIRGFQRARCIIPPEEIQSWQMIHQIEYLYEIILCLHEIKHLIEKQKILYVINKELTLLLRRLTWLLRGMARSAAWREVPLPKISKFTRLLRTFEKYYLRHLKRFNQEQFLAFTLYMDTVQKLERRVINLTELLKRLEYRS
jgi:hypothetical protein